MLGAVIAAACGDSAPSAPDVRPGERRTNAETTEPADGPWQRVVHGSTGPGSVYAVYVPRAWNGSLVTIAHGFRDAALPVGLNEESYVIAMREAMGAQGYAVAYSSYSENGFAVKDGAQRTHALRGLATAALDAPPRQHYVMGFSLGGAVALSLVESYPSQYDGALLACGMVGGSLTQTQYLGHARVLFDAAYPGVLQGTVLGVPFNYTVDANGASGAIIANLPRAFAIASTRQTPLPFQPGNVPQLVQSLVTAVTFHARGINNITDLVHGQSPFGNAGETYVLGTPAFLGAPQAGALIAGLDAGAVRVEMSNAARQYLAAYYTPTGRLARPVVTVHNAWDPIVPAFHEDSLAAVVGRAGASAMLTQQRFSRYGHCTFEPAELLGAFATLRQRAEQP